MLLYYGVRTRHVFGGQYDIDAYVNCSVGDEQIENSIDLKYENYRQRTITLPEPTISCRVTVFTADGGYIIFPRYVIGSETGSIQYNHNDVTYMPPSSDRPDNPYPNLILTITPYAGSVKGYSFDLNGF